MISPLPYLVHLRDYLKNREPDAWKWFCEHRSAQKQTEEVRFHLLTSTYRLDRENETENALYLTAESIRDRLGLSIPITLYQSQESLDSNAQIFILPDEVHLVLSGSLRQNLQPKEFEALFAHEFAHSLLETQENGEFRIVRELLLALSNDETFGETYLASLRLFELYTELFCDRIALDLPGDLESVVSMFIKVHTGLSDISAKSYLKQADEIFASKSGQTLRTGGITHPEIFIRVRSLKLVSEKTDDVESEIAAMIEGETSLEALDLLARDQLHGLTRQLIDAFLEPAELQTELTLAHARLFFNDYEPPKPKNRTKIDFARFSVTDSSLRDYWNYVLLDFTTADRDLEDLPLHQALELARKLRIDDSFVEIVQKELKMRKRDLDRIIAQHNASVRDNK